VGNFRALVGFVFAALAAHGLGAPAAQSAPPRVVEPSEVVSTFYRWYLRSLTQDRDPVTQDTATLRKYVAAALIGEIDKRLKSPEGLDSDYFLQAQDYLDDWEGNVSVAQLENTGTVATTVLTLGGKGQTAYRLKVTLKKEAGTWKIAKVQRPHD